MSKHTFGEYLILGFFVLLGLSTVVIALGQGIW